MTASTEKIDDTLDLDFGEGEEEAPRSPEPDVEVKDSVDTSDEGWSDLLPEGEKDEIERLLSTPYGPFNLQDGTSIRVKQLKLREFLSMLRILTTGSGPALSQLELDTGNPTAFAQNIVAALIFAIPEAEREVVEFIQMVTEPEDLPTKPSDAMRARADLATRLENPELEDAINIIAVVVRSEATDLAALGKRLRAMFKTAQKLGVVPNL